MSTINISEENFLIEVMDSEKPVLLDFWASWCGPCRMVGPVLEEIAAERPDIKVGKINIDEQQALAAQFGVTSIPTLVVMKKGEIANKAVGAMPKDDILALL
ncbi:MAG: thioredoxin [Clostridiales bacterium]|nr:thioredoxin [Clostridiales bacterium]MDD7035502.1 thioredoxin [Bacillota bacterium]